jgi:hypothetical protein
MTGSRLPMPNSLEWVHATNSLAKVEKAMEDSDITAIEADLLMGCEIMDHVVSGENPDDECPLVPIMAHPLPRRPHLRSSIMALRSDMTASSFLTHFSTDDDGTHNLLKHIKLDFKTLDALDPTLTELDHLDIRNPYGKTVFLNADILPGPGTRSKEPIIPADAFLETCLEHIEKVRNTLHVLPSLLFVCKM